MSHVTKKDKLVELVGGGIYTNYKILQNTANFDKSLLPRHLKCVAIMPFLGANFEFGLVILRDFLNF